LEIIAYLILKSISAEYIRMYALEKNYDYQSIKAAVKCRHRFEGVLPCIGLFSTT
jgi:hypothetical protein